MVEPNVKALNDTFVQTLNTNPAVIKQAEQQLAVFSKQPGYAIAVLTLVSLDSPVELRQAAAVNFKNFVKYNWSPREDADIHIADAEKDKIKGLITSLMLNTPNIVRAQLSEALTIVGQHDFPAKWPTLLPELVERMKSGDTATVAGVLETANSIFKRYRNQMMTDSLSRELEYSQQLVRPLLETLQKLVKQVQATAPHDTTVLKQLLGSVRLALRVFFSLNSPGLTEDFENTLKEWMAEFHTLLTYDNSALVESGDKESVVDAVKAAVCQNINLLVTRDEEEFSEFLSTFVQDVWTQLVQVSVRPNQDQLAMSAIQFLTTVSKSARHAGLFKTEDALKQICEKIVIPNLRLRDDLEEMFEMNYVEYVRRDTEGSDFDTRRRAATELVKTLAAQFETEVTQLFTGYVGALLAEVSRSADAWRSKDTAMYLVVALTVRGKTAAHGATATNQLVNVADFFENQVLPELRSGPQGQAILQADALKFLTIFRSQLPKAGILSALPHVIALQRSESNVVHSYAAILIERLLASKENGQPRFSVADLTPFLQPLLENLFAAFSIVDSAENEYVMKCVMRVISFVGPQIAPVAPHCLDQLSKLLLAVCKNPTVPGFNHFLFESVAALIANSVAADPSTVVTLENMLFPPFQIVLQEDVQEFHPYVFQIFSQLIELRPAPLPDTYLQILPPLLTPVLWERSGNVPALSRLVRAYLTKAAPQIVQRGALTGILGVFQKLVAGKAHDHEGFRILESLAQHAPYDAFSQYLPEIWRILFQRLMAAKTTKYVAGLLNFVSLFICQKGANAAQSSIDGMQAGLFRMLLEQVWLPAMGSPRSADQQKVLSVATTKVLCDCTALQMPEAAGLWGQLLQALLGQLENLTAAEEGGEDEGDDQEFSSYSAAYARLHNAAHIDPDPLPEVMDAKRYLAESLGRMSQAQPGRVVQLVQSHVPAELQQRLQGYFQGASVSIS